MRGLRRPGRPAAGRACRGQRAPAAGAFAARGGVGRCAAGHRLRWCAGRSALRPARSASPVRLVALGPSTFGHCACVAPGPCACVAPGPAPAWPPRPCACVAPGAFRVCGCTRLAAQVDRVLSGGGPACATCSRSGCVRGARGVGGWAAGRRTRSWAGRSVRWLARPFPPGARSTPGTPRSRQHRPPGPPRSCLCLPGPAVFVLALASGAHHVRACAGPGLPPPWLYAPGRCRWVVARSGGGLLGSNAPPRWVCSRGVRA